MNSFQSDEMEYVLPEPAELYPAGVSSLAKGTPDCQIRANQPNTVHRLDEGNGEAGSENVIGSRDSAPETDRHTAPMSADQERDLGILTPASSSAPASSVPNKAAEETAKASATYRAPQLRLLPPANPLIRPLCPGSSLGNTAPNPGFPVWTPNAFLKSVRGDSAQLCQEWSGIPNQNPLPPAPVHTVTSTESPTRIEISTQAPGSPGILTPIQVPTLPQIEIIPIEAPAPLAMPTKLHALGSSSMMSACEPVQAGTAPSCPQPLAPTKQKSRPAKPRKRFPTPRSCFCQILNEEELVSVGKQLYFKQIRTLKQLWLEGTTRDQIMAELDRLWNNLSEERKRQFFSEAVEKIINDLVLMDPICRSSTQQKQFLYLQSHGRPSSMSFNPAGRSASGCFCRSAPAPRVNPDLAILMGVPVPRARTSSRAVSSPVTAVSKSQRNAPLVQKTVRRSAPPETSLTSQTESGTRRASTGQRKRKSGAPKISKPGLEEAPKPPKASKPRKKALKKGLPTSSTKTAGSNTSRIQAVSSITAYCSSVNGIQPVEVQLYNLEWDDLEKVYKLIPTSVLNDCDTSLEGPTVASEGSSGIKQESPGVAEDPTVLDKELSTLTSTDTDSGEVDAEATCSWVLGLNPLA